VIEGVGSFVLDRESAVLTQPVLELLAAVWNGTTDAAGPTTLATEILPGNVFSALRVFGPFWPRWAKHDLTSMRELRPWEGALHSDWPGG